jgi:hypothetical protein
MAADGESKKTNMKVLYVGLARSLWVFDLNLLNPQGLSLQPVIDKLTDKYKFGKAPKSPVDYDNQKALSFKSGTFIDSKGTPVSITFTIYTDGFVADTTASTDASTEFLVEMRETIAGEFGLKLPTKIRKAFVSQIDVECDRPLIQLNPGLQELAEFINKNVKTIDEEPRVYECAALNFWTEDTGKVSAPSPFKFERKITAPFSANHYFSQAPLETQQHLKLLDMLQNVLKR